MGPRTDGTLSATMDRIEETIRARIAPPAELLDRVARVRADLVHRAEEEAARRSSPLVRALVAGSAARGTFLADRLDIDLFLLFPPELARERLRDEGLALGRAILSGPETRYAEHPYLRGSFGGFTVDAVPGYAVPDPSRPISPVDRTPYHQEYLSRHESAATVSEVRLTKQFLRAQGVYGSEARTEGFSGYLVELLTIRFGSFRGFVESARGWRIPVRLGEPGTEPPRLPEDVALILADPVDPHRNVSSALSRRNLGLVIVAAREYLARPSLSWFEVRASAPLSREEAARRVRERGSHVVLVELSRPDLVDDTLYPQIRKAERAVSEELSRSGFEVLGSASAADRERVLLAVELAQPLRAGARLRDGPPAGIDRVGEFLSKWTAPGAPVLQGPYVRPDGSLAVETREENREPVPFLKERLSRLSLGRDLTPTPRAPGIVRALDESVPSEALGEVLRDLLAKRLPWLDRTEPAAPT